ncbi:MAG: protein kinase domain-containing protein [Bryobacteraceae bacterium]
MTPGHWEQVKALFSAALERPAPQRHSFLGAARVSDPAVRGEVERILAEYERAGNFLEEPVVLPPACNEPSVVHAFAAEDLISDRYSIVRFIARGGMGEVYEAQDLELGGVVALKTLRSGADLSSASLGRFKREALARRVNDRHVCQTYDFGRHRRPDGTEVPYLTMEFLRGETLAERIHRAGPFTPAEALPLVLEMIQALSAAHRLGIIHRDFKSSNVILVPDAGKLSVKVTDFGLARTNQEEATEWTAPGQIVGTPAYMAPEQFRGEASEASDIYALGMVMHEMITGVRPFRPQGFMNGSISIARARIPDLDPRWHAAISKCLEPEPAHRFAKIENAGAALLFDEREGTVSMTGPARRRPGKKLFPWAAALIAGLILIAIGLVAARSWITRANRERRVVVIPFTDLDKSGANQAFCDGLTETLVSQLTQLERFQGSLLVIPSADVRKEKIASAGDAQKALGANLVLTGTVQRSSNGIRLIANLIDATKRRQIGSRIIQIPQKDVVSMQDSVITQIAGMLDVPVRSEVKDLLAKGLTENPGAYDFYIQGYGFLRRYGPIEDADHAVEEFNRALAIDPSFALAYAGLGEAYWRKYVLTKDRIWIEKAWPQCERALKFNEALAPVHATLGLLYAGTGKYDRAEREYQRALKIDPGNHDALIGLADAYQASGRFQDAETTFRRAISERPGYWNGYARIGKFYVNRTRYSDAIVPFQRAIELTPDNATGYANLGGLYIYMGRYQDAERELKKSLAIKSTAGANSNLATAYLFEHKYADAVPILEKVVTPASMDYRLWGNLGDAYRWSAGTSAKSANAYRQAIRLAEVEISVNPKDVRALSAMATYLAKIGEHKEAMAAAKNAIELAADDAEVLFDAALTLELSGERQEALAALARAIQAGYSRNDIVNDSDLQKLRTDPKAIAILSR